MSQKNTWRSNLRFTVFTPTYNRAHTLLRVYDSLSKQTCKNFEWVIVDDGSTDGTDVIVNKWQAQADFSIRYYWQENQGKHIAINKGACEAKGELFAIFDSDDACTTNALERILLHWEAIPITCKAQFAGIMTLCKNQHGDLVGRELPCHTLDSNLLEVIYKYKLGGEKWPIFRTAILREFPFPEAIQKQYLPESIVWFQISKKYKIRFINEALRIYYIEKESMIHGVKASKNALGGHYEHLSYLNEHIDYIKLSFWELIKSAIHYSRFSFHIHLKLIEQLRRLQNPLAKALWMATVLIGLGIYLKDNLREK